MPRTLADLANDLRKLVLQLGSGAAPVGVAADVARAIIQDLIAVTPVDSGKAVSNWQISVAGPISKILPAYFPGKGGVTAAMNRAAAYERAMGVLSTVQPGQLVYIGNALPYIRRLNDGYSAQAPAGFIERAVLIGRLFAQGEQLTT